MNDVHSIMYSRYEGFREITRDYVEMVKKGVFWHADCCANVRKWRHGVMRWIGLARGLLCECAEMAPWRFWQIRERDFGRKWRHRVAGGSGREI